MSLVPCFALEAVEWRPSPRTPRPLFDGIDLEIPSGEVFTLFGPSGEGKTVLLKMLAGVFPPTAGRVLFRGRDRYRLSTPANRELAATIGMAFQKGGLFDSLNVADNLDFVLRERTRLKAAGRAERIARLLADVGLTGLDERAVTELSGGQQKRLGIARALALDPEVVLYDDPTAGLDPLTSRAILELILRLKREGEMTVLIVASDPRQAFAYSDRMGFLHSGRLTVGSPEALRASEDAAVVQFLEGRLEGPLTALAFEEGAPPGESRA